MSYLFGGMPRKFMGHYPKKGRTSRVQVCNVLEGFVFSPRSASCRVNFRISGLYKLATVRCMGLYCRPGCVMVHYYGLSWVDASSGPQDWGPFWWFPEVGETQYRPQDTIILIMRTPKRCPLILGNPKPYKIP